MNDIIVAPSGGALPAAIGIVRLSGEGCDRILDEIFLAKCNKNTTERIINKLYYGKLLGGNGKTVDLCMAVYFKAPNSYTGEAMAEIYTHGSAAIVTAAIESAVRAGARYAEPGEFTKRAFLNGKLDLTEAEATADLIHSTSELAAQTAVSQLSGSVSGEIRALRADLTALLAHYYAVCDYTDEDIEPFEYEKAAQTLRAASNRLKNLADGFERGNAIKNGIPVAVIGKPNAGKSSLFNALAGEDRAIVTDEAGTTRDVIEEHITIGGALFRMLDTAGIRQAGGKAEAMGIERSRKAAETAQGVICVFDGSRELTEEDIEAAKLIPDTLPKCAVINKSDIGILPDFEEKVKKLNIANIFILSAKTGDGLDALTQWLKALIPDAKGVLVTSPRQAKLMRSASESCALAAECAEAGLTADAFLSDAERALDQLGKITGETASADIASEIFSRFCVGK
ncbi:MAG: tRNA uridine-5-carboxymethylaminomethyl(34) synthesis GTPase MnmE [Clostridia bacterium]|nr:tRNA uridine-5-carboxymethylaminomethyl(34) synthesis GTPase MnmE [Clostridia bacterium]